MARGFKNLSKQRRQKISSAAGKKAHLMKKAHQFDVTEARAAAELSTKARKKKAAFKAARRLLESGFTPAQLASLNLSDDEYIYYGGSRNITDKRILIKLARLVLMDKSIVEGEGGGSDA